MIAPRIKELCKARLPLVKFDSNKTRRNQLVIHGKALASLAFAARRLELDVDFFLLNVADIKDIEGK